MGGVLPLSWWERDGKSGEVVVEKSLNHQMFLKSRTGNTRDRRD